MTLTRRPYRTVCAVAALAAVAVALALTGALPGPGATSRAAGAPGETETQPYTDDSVPARNVTMIGSSPQEAAGETWGVGLYDGASVLVRYASASGWSLEEHGLLDVAGQPLSGFRLDQPEAAKYPNPSPLAGQMTPRGGGVLAGTVAATASEPERQVVLVREPGGAFRETAPPPAGMLKTGERLLSLSQTPMIAALEEADGRTGALVVPVGSSVDSGVLHWNGADWTRESIDIPEASEEQLEVLAIGASSPHDAWFLARLSSQYPAGSVALFRRSLSPGSGSGSGSGGGSGSGSGGGSGSGSGGSGSGSGGSGSGEAPVWRPVTVKPGGEAGEPLAVPVEGHKTEPFTVPSSDLSQILTVTGEGVWIDGLRKDAQASTTMFFKPAGEEAAEAAAGEVRRAWCELPATAPAGSPACQYTLPEPLPTGPSRSFAWADASTPEGFGERVVTGLPDGDSLRLEGTEFRRVLSLGGDTGASFGAAFSNAREGWLGKELLPVLLTKPGSEPSRLAPWPVSFRHALLALAPQPEAPVGALSSQALAVGLQGEVARYQPGRGWLPESLLGPGGRYETPELRAVAWPTPTRAYAVGDPTEGHLNQMWLWRAETGLWEPDPAEPDNFRGELLGIAFDPSEPARGYAVGQSGVLLRYGKTWTQEPTCATGVPEPCLPPEVASASFTSIAFAGAEAIVAYRKLIDPQEDRYEGGLLVNEGSGWRVEAQAAAAMGGNVPWAVAGLADGGAAFTAAGASEGAEVYERQAAGAPWQAVRFPGDLAPGSLTLFRENGALRAIAAGGESDTYAVENGAAEAPPPAGFPPSLVNPYPLASDPEKGVLRQTASGWSDEEHELNNAREPPGEYAYYDTVYQPDPIAAVLVAPDGSQGWAVGGFVNTEHHALETADVDRYPAEAAAPPGVGSAPLGAAPGTVAFAIGGGGQCAAPCASRADARIGPDVWLSHALEQAGRIEGARAFIYTGPRVSTGATAGPKVQPLPYERELGRYAEILGKSRIPTYAVASPSELDSESGGSEAPFEEAFSGLPAPFGRPRCETAGCQSAYYAFSSAGVRVLVLDDTTPVAAAQLSWLEAELAGARKRGEPAIAVGNGYLRKELESPETAVKNAASAVAQALVCGRSTSACGQAEGGASAYFFDSPEQNVKLPLRAGAASIPSFGSGTLGYVNYVAEESGGFIGAGGFMLAQVQPAKRNAATNVAPVEVQLIPDIGELTMEAKQGTLVQRSKVLSFEGLARRPRAGSRAHNRAVEAETSPYIPIPSDCLGAQCEEGLFPEYTFTSSDIEVGQFVEQNTQISGSTPEALQNAKGEPIPDEPRDSGHELTPYGRFSENAKGEQVNERGEAVPGQRYVVFCTYNPGTTTVTLSAGGLSYSLPVTVQAGSVRQPCGTVPVKQSPAAAQAASLAPPPVPAPAPAGPAPASAPPVVPVPPPPAPLALPAPGAPPAATPPAPFFIAQAPPFVPVAFVPPPLPAPAEPTPPTGTSAVTSPVEAAQKEEEEEEATESVSNQALAYSAAEHEPLPEYLLGLVLIAALAGVSVRKRPRRGGRRVRVAPATLSSMRAQRRAAGRGRRIL